jgi:type II secretory pathway pseudopilin PulG
MDSFCSQCMVMINRGGITIVELFVVLAIISIMLALLMPAVQSARERARETVCKNNVRQINLAIAQFAEARKQLPSPSPPGQTGGWMVEILPFIEQHNLKDNILIGVPIANAPASVYRPPPIFRCPRRTVLDQTPQDAMSPAHYVFVPVSRRESFYVFDAPITLSDPWIKGPEMDYNAVIKLTGPHSNGFFYAAGFQQGVGFMLNGQDIR